VSSFVILQERSPKTRSLKWLRKIVKIWNILKPPPCILLKAKSTQEEQSIAETMCIRIVLYPWIPLWNLNTLKRMIYFPNKHLWHEEHVLLVNWNGRPKCLVNRCRSIKKIHPPIYRQGNEAATNSITPTLQSSTRNYPYVT